MRLQFYLNRSPFSMDTTTGGQPVSTNGLVVEIWIITAKYIPPVIMSFGLVGNVLSVAVMQRPNYAKSSLWVYLRYLAMCDIGFVLVQFERCIIHYYPSMRETFGTFFCKQYYYMALVSAVSTCFGVVLMTVDRFVAVTWPLRASYWCTRKRAIITCAVNSITVLTLCSPQLKRVMLDDVNLPDRERCNLTPKWLEEALYIVFNIGLIASPLVTSALNVGIVLVIRKSRRQRHKMAATREHQQDNQMNVILLVISTSFCICIWPYTIDWIAFSFFIPLDSLPQLLLRRMSYDIILMMATCNSSLNFYLYCFSSKTIRNNLREMFWFHWKTCYKMRTVDS